MSLDHAREIRQEIEQTKGAAALEMRHREECAEEIVKAIERLGDRLVGYLGQKPGTFGGAPIVFEKKKGGRK